MDLHKKLLGQALVCTNGRIEEAEDLVQDTLLKGLLQPSPPCLKWHRITLKRKAINATRNAKGQRGTLRVHGQELYRLPELDKGLALQSLWEAVRGLPERERKVTELYYDQERNTTEISRDLGMPLGTVCKTLFNARNLLKGVLT